MRMKVYATRTKALRQFVAINLALGYPRRGKRGDGVDAGPAIEPDPEQGEHAQGWTWSAVLALHNPVGPSFAIGGEVSQIGHLHGVTVTLPSGLGDETINLAGHIPWDYAVTYTGGDPHQVVESGHKPVPLRKVAAVIQELVG